MPRVLRLAGFEFYVYVDDHAPPHVHAFRGNQEAVIALGTEGVHPTLLRSQGMREHDVVDALLIAGEHQAALLGIWRKFHG